MGSHTLPYPVDTCFGGQVNIRRLEETIRNSDINIALHGCVLDEFNIVQVTFKDILPQSEKTKLDGGSAEDEEHPPLSGSVLADHDGTPDVSNPDRIVIKNPTTGTDVSFPATSRNTPIFQPSIIAPGDLFYGTGAFDEVTGALKIGEGGRIKFDVSEVDSTTVVEGRFYHYVRILGGELRAWSSTVDDELSLDIVFPASAPASTPGVGNADLNTSGPSPVFVPNVSGDGDYTVDGSTLEVGHINQDLCPVPAVIKGPDGKDVGIGFWNWDPEQYPSITPAPAMDGNYNLIPEELCLLRQANKYPVADLEVTPAAGIQGKKVLPHWIWRFILSKGPKVGIPTQCRVLLYTSRVTTR